MFGRRRVLLAGIGGFIAASALCALAPIAETLIAARVLQGAIAAIMVPQGFGLIRELFGDEGQQKAFGVFGPVMGLAAVAGPLVGGGLVNLNVLGLRLAGDLPRQRPDRPGRDRRSAARYLPAHRAGGAGGAPGRAERRCWRWPAASRSCTR